MSYSLIWPMSHSLQPCYTDLLKVSLLKEGNMPVPSNHLVWYAGTSHKRTIALQGVPKESPEW